MAFYKSTDGGTTWSNHFVADDGRGYHLAVDPNNDNTVYVGGISNSEYVLFKSSDGGLSWVKIGTGDISGEIYRIAVDPVYPSRVYVGTSYGLYRSENSGSAWKKILDYGTKAIVIDPHAPNEIYAGGYYGVYKSLDCGQTWLEWNKSLGVWSINALDLVPQNKTIFAGTSGGSVYKNRQSELCLLNIVASAGGTTDPAPNIYAYSVGKNVEIRAKPSTHNIFYGWSGDATGTANPIMFVMNADKSITANFQKIIYPPLNFSGIKKENRALLKVEYINVLTWQKNPENEDSVKYRIYQTEGNTRSLVAELPANTTQYWHKYVEKDKEYTYALVACDESGRESEAAHTKVR